MVGQNWSWQNMARHKERPPFIIALLLHSIIKSVRRFLTYITLELLINLQVGSVRCMKLVTWVRYTRLVRSVRCMVRYVGWVSLYLIFGYEVTMMSSIWEAISITQSCVFLISCLYR